MTVSSSSSRFATRLLLMPTGSVPVASAATANVSSNTTPVVVMLLSLNQIILPLVLLQVKSPPTLHLEPVIVSLVLS